jgi:hypothetical protein
MTYGDPYVDEIPAKAPIGDCNGWLLHNRRLCPCYAVERAEIRAREQTLPWPLVAAAFAACTLMIPLIMAAAR